MTSREKPIRDIRFFEQEPGGPRSVLPGYVGKIYAVLDRGEIGMVGQRYAMRLAERGFQTRGYHHIYVVLDPDRPAGEVRIAPVSLEPWMQIVDVGLPLHLWPREDTAAQRACLIRSATRVLERLCEEHSLDGAMLAAVEAEVLEQGPNLEFTRLVKETAAGTIRVTFRALPYRVPSPVYLEFEERTTGRRGKIELLRVKCVDDLFPLIASASASRHTITLRPRQSARAKIYTKQYEKPICVPIRQVLEQPSDDRELEGGV